MSDEDVKTTPPDSEASDFPNPEEDKEKAAEMRIREREKEPPRPGDPQYNPLFDPKVKHVMDRLHSEKAYAEQKLQELSGQMAELERRLKEKERAELTEVERLKAENADLLRDIERLKTEMEKLNSSLQDERTRNRRMELANREGIKPRHLKYIIGNTDEEILASIEEIKQDWDYAGLAEKARAEQEEKARREAEKKKREEEKAREVPTDRGIAKPPKEGAGVVEEPVFTREQIARMNHDEYGRHRDAIKKALREGRIR